MEEKKIICKCPKCGANVVEGRFNYECEHLEGGTCDFKFAEKFFEVEITEEIITGICNGETTESFTFKKPDKEWNARLKYDEAEGRVAFVFENNRPKAEVIGVCPACGGNVKETKDFYLCEHYKESCSLLIGKTMNGHPITKEEALKLLSGETLPEATFTWRSGKTGTARLKLNDEGKVDYLFK